jgi:Transposase domain (DUF772)
MGPQRHASDEEMDAATWCRHLLPQGSVFAFLADHCQQLFPAELFADLTRHGGGHPLVPAEVIATVMVLQALEGLSDRQAISALRRDIAWKVACGLRLDDGRGWSTTRWRCLPPWPTHNGSGQTRAALRAAGHTQTIKPIPLSSAVPGGFAVHNFRSDQQAGTVRCPAGYQTTITASGRASFARWCRRCPLRQRCTTAEAGRTIKVHCSSRESMWRRVPPRHRLSIAYAQPTA